MFKTKFAVFAALVVAASVSAQQPPQTAPAVVPDGKIAMLNTQVFPGQILELKQKYEQVDAQFKPRSDKIKADQTRLQAIQTELSTKGPSMPADRVAQLQAEGQDLEKQIKRDVEDARADLAKTEDRATKPVREKLFQFLQGYAQQRGIVLIINTAGVAQTGSIAYANPATDITEDFIKEYNKANPVPVAPATPQPAAPKKPGQ
ncbi:MAG: OmpH family outer membrane protein [Acidobacteriota bacterium]